tara:strand:+ start:15668 stop:17596 length:1929 start_codon:yes stop_codon:yes gene_type:complete
MAKFLINSKKNITTTLNNIDGCDNTISYSNITIQYSNPFHEWTNSNNEKCIVLGYVTRLVDNNGVTTKISENKKVIEIINDFDNIPKVEGRFIFIKINSDGKLSIYSDNNGKVEVYMLKINNQIYLSSSLDLLNLSSLELKNDQIALAHSLTVYGSRPGKKQTLYQNISRLGLNEAFIVSNGDVDILKRKFIPISTKPEYSDDKLEDYSKFFIEAIRSRASENGNVVYISGGWDSSSVLAVLVHLFGKEKTRCIIGRQKFSKRTGIANQIEIDKATAICEYFGVKLDIIDLNFMTGADDILRRAKDFAMSHNFANMTTITHFMLAEAASKMFKGDEAFFAGEMSDGAHNFGFSQFVTIHHPASKSFREYSDKMASYLYGPTFLNEMLSGRHKDDPVWKIFMQFNPDVKFDELKTGKIEINKQFLSSFFLRSGRIPLYSIDNSQLLTKYGAEQFVNQSEEIYLKEAYENLSPDNLYSHILHLYDTFHWQCATVATHQYTAAYFGLNLYQPYRDKAIINFLSGMPESWGRGLDFRNTKFPLKWMLKNKIDYPYHLQEGSHAYIYDEDPSFSHLAEVVYGSSWNEVFKKSLNDGKFINLLDDKIFNKSYINELIKEFNLDKEVRGQRLTDLTALCVHSAFGLYNE